MKLLPLLLGVSLVANAALVVVNKRAADRARGGDSAASAGESGFAPLPRRAGPASGDAPAIVAAFKNNDMETLREELLAAGLDEATVRDVVRARIQKRYESRIRALQPARDASRAWWKNDEGWGWNEQTKEQRAAIRAVRQEMEAEYQSVLGESMMTEIMRNNPWMERQYGFLPPGKREAFQQLEQDYNELGQEMQAATRGFRMPADAEQARFLAEEKRRDMMELLSPEEFADYERRRSRTANNLRWRMTQMDATEAEYVALFEIQRDFDEQYNQGVDFYGNPYTDRTSQEQRDARAAAEKAMQAQIKDTLGVERYKAYVRSQDHDYQQLLNAAKRFELPADTPVRIYDLRDEVPQAALKIADDPNLTPEQKKAEVTKLAEETRDRVQTLLGAEVAKVYFDQGNGLHWLRELEKGTIITFDENGGQQHRRLEQPAKKPAAKAK